jgi:hypothetical protein
MIVRAGRIDTSAKMAGMPEDRHQGARLTGSGACLWRGDVDYSVLVLFEAASSLLLFLL